MPSRELARSPTYLRAEEAPLAIGTVTDPNAEYIDQHLHAIRTAIRRRVDADIDDRSVLKNLKNIPSPEKYSGRDDAEEFIAWLKAMLRWLEIHRVVGYDLDGDRVTVLGQFLTGAALDWYDEIIDNIHPQGRVWIFEDAICAMFKRFIHKSTARSAADNFHATRYIKSSGVNGLWEQLIKWAMKMPRYPDDYTFNRRFVDALPEDIAIPMFRNKGVSVERSTPALLKRIALEQEDNNRVVEDYRSSHRSAPRTGDQSAGRPMGPTSALAPSMRRPRPFNGGRRPDGFRERTTDDRPSPARLAPRPEPPNTRPQPPPPRAPATVAAPAGSSGPRTPAVLAAGANPGRVVRCYNCNREGHIASACPQPRVMHQRAARIVDPDAQATTQQPRIVDDREPPTDITTIIPTAEPVGSDTYPPSEAVDPDDMNSEQLGEYLETEYQVYGGSQYDSEEESPQGNGTHDDYGLEDGDNDVYFGMMRRRSLEDSDAESVLESEGDHPSATDLVREDFTGLTRADVLQQGSELGLAIFEATIVRMAELDIPSSPSEDFEDMPPLQGESDSPMPMARNEAAHQLHAEVQYRDQFAAEPPTVEVPLASEAMAAWNSFENGSQGELEFQRMRAMVYRLIGANQYLCSTLEQERDARQQLQYRHSDLQRERDRIHSHLAWSRHEVGWALEREQSALNAMNTALMRSAEALNENRERIRIREEILNHPLSPDLTDDMFEGDYLDDPSMSTANHVLQRATAQGPSPPAYQGRGPALRAMTHTSAVVAPPTMPADMITRARTGRRPIPRRIEQTCLALLMRVNGLEALVLLDSGSTGDSISPDFARVCDAPVMELENPATLQLGCVGSRSRINRGVRVPIAMGSFATENYLDIVNLDRYDVVLGTPFMRRFGVLLDFGNSRATIQGVNYAALTPREEDRYANRRNAPRGVPQRSE